MHSILIYSLCWHCVCSPVWIVVVVVVVCFRKCHRPKYGKVAPRHEQWLLKSCWFKPTASILLANVRSIQDRGRNGMGGCGLLSFSFFHTSKVPPTQIREGLLLLLQLLFCFACCCCYCCFCCWCWCWWKPECCCFVRNNPNRFVIIFHRFE